LPSRMREDARQTGRDIPALGRGAAAALRLARRARREGAGAAPSTTPLRLPTGADESLTPPMATAFVDADEWEARAHALGGTSNALLVGVAAQLARQMGRVTADGSVHSSSHPRFDQSTTGVGMAPCGGHRRRNPRHHRWGAGQPVVSQITRPGQLCDT
jgi:hypothetical protein